MSQILLLQSMPLSGSHEPQTFRLRWDQPLRFVDTLGKTKHSNTWEHIKTQVRFCAIRYMISLYLFNIMKCR